MLRVVRKIGYAAGTVARRVLLCMRQERFFDGAHEPREEDQTQAAAPVGSPGRRLIRRPVQSSHSLRSVVPLARLSSYLLLILLLVAFVSWRLVEAIGDLPSLLIMQ
ncbi:hypothetical protein FA95DRAFT_904528 [Auriscalpium vulgare]|uniref:Uncharacterized protein n=1 Tax=Auriscalpium vulgare TaxID=40419 RepID=A0ACB8R9H3_9AGAM|nr:hypothetical protein FA95DRAFT_904528 [Auriscalpium vulgare]